MTEAILFHKLLVGHVNSTKLSFWDRGSFDKSEKVFGFHCSCERKVIEKNFLNIKC